MASPFSLDPSDLGAPFLNYGQCLLESDYIIMHTYVDYGVLLSILFDLHSTLVRQAFITPVYYMRKTEAWKGKSNLLTITWLEIAAEPAWDSCVLRSLHQMVPLPPPGVRWRNSV